MNRHQRIFAATVALSVVTSAPAFAQVEWGSEEKVARKASEYESKRLEKLLYLCERGHEGACAKLLMSLDVPALPPEVIEHMQLGVDHDSDEIRDLLSFLLLPILSMDQVDESCQILAEEDPTLATFEGGEVEEACYRCAEAIRDAERLARCTRDTLVVGRILDLH